MGNILTQLRHKRDGTKIEDLSYSYQTSGGKLVRNRLYHLDDVVGSGVDATDIDDMGSFDADVEDINVNNNYSYDEEGRLVRDNQEKISKIVWRVDGKVKEIQRAAGDAKWLKFDYDAMGHRIGKHVYSNDGETHERSTYYILDAQGNQISTYDHEVVSETAQFNLKERNIFGSSRIGSKQDSMNVLTATITQNYTQVLGYKYYEFSIHLGNVLTVYSDVKIPLDTDNDNVVDEFGVPIRNIADYSPFGVALDGRTVSLDNYRYGFQNQEEDSETGLVNYKYRMHDPRVGRFFAVDPLASKYPWNSCYAFSENRVLDAIELEGLEAVLIDDIIPTENGYIIKLVPDEEIINNATCPFQLRLAPGLDSRYPDGKVIYGDRESNYNFLYEGLNKKIKAELIEGFFCLTKDKCWTMEDVNGNHGQDGLVPAVFAFQIADLKESKANSLGPLLKIPISPIVEEDLDIVNLVKKEYSFISPASADGLVRYTLRLHQFDAPNTIEIQSDYFENGKMTFTGNETITFEVPANSEFTISISGESHHDKFEITGEAEIIKKN